MRVKLRMITSLIPVSWRSVFQSILIRTDASVSTKNDMVAIAEIKPGKPRVQGSGCWKSLVYRLLNLDAKLS